MPNDGIRLKIILIIEVRKLEFTDFYSHSLLHQCIVSLIFSLIANLLIACNKYIIKEFEIYSTITDTN